MSQVSHSAGCIWSSMGGVFAQLVAPIDISFPPEVPTDFGAQRTDHYLTQQLVRFPQAPYQEPDPEAHEYLRTTSQGTHRSYMFCSYLRISCVNRCLSARRFYADSNTLSSLIDISLTV